MFHMFAMEHGSQLRAEQKDEARHIAPDQDGNYGADRAVNLVVIQVFRLQAKT